jgi:hypothetical protein
MKAKLRVILGATLCAFLFISAAAQNPSVKLPEHVKYYFVLRHIALLNQEAAEAERKGEDSTKYRQHYKNFAALKDGQVGTLNQIAADCLREMVPLDARVKQLVSESRAKLPGGKLEAGQPFPQGSSELKQLDAERDQVMQRAYARLRESFGEVEFKRWQMIRSAPWLKS